MRYCLLCLEVLLQRLSYAYLKAKSMSRRDCLKPEALNEPLARQKVNEFGNPSFSSDYSSAFDIGKEYAQQEHCWKSAF